jgi:hypothetical protein
MENKTFLSAMLYFHKLVFKEQYDPFMVIAHVCLEGKIHRQQCC